MKIEDKYGIKVDDTDFWKDEYTITYALTKNVNYINYINDVPPCIVCVVGGIEVDVSTDNYSDDALYNHTSYDYIDDEDVCCIAEVDRFLIDYDEVKEDEFIEMSGIDKKDLKDIISYIERHSVLECTDFVVNNPDKFL